MKRGEGGVAEVVFRREGTKVSDETVAGRKVRSEQAHGHCLQTRPHRPLPPRPVLAGVHSLHTSARIITQHARVGLGHWAALTRPRPC